MDYKKTAAEVVKLIGGKENVTHYEHCSTRLRFNLADMSKAKTEEIKKVSGVMGVVVAGGQYQVVIGNSVVEVYDEVVKLIPNGVSADASSEAPQKWTDKLMANTVKIFQPLVAPIAGAGVLKALLVLLDMLGILAADSTIYVTLARISDATIFFIPILAAYSTAVVMKSNRYVAVAAMGYFLHTGTTTALANGLTLFGMSVANIAYGNQIFPAILTTIFLAYVEKFVTKISPKPIRIFFVPMVSLLITIPVTLLFLGPLGYNMGVIISTVVIFIYEKLSFVGVGIVAAILPFMVAAGMHKAMIPYATNQLTALGYELFYLPASLAHNIAESGACFAVALRTKNEELRQVAISAAISAFFGITEPALYGVTLTHKRALAGVVIGGGLAGMVAGLFLLKAFTLVGPGFASMPMFVDPANASNFINAWICFAIAIAGAFIVTFVVWKDEDRAEVEKKVTNPVVETTEAVETIGSQETASSNVNEFVSPLDGKSIPLSEVNDEMFATKTLGDGLAIIPSNSTLVAPVDAEVIMLFETKHAIGLRSENGTELLVHIGINTVGLGGNGFTAHVKVGDKVKTGDKLIDFNLDTIKNANLDTTVMVVVSSNEYNVNNQFYGEIKSGDPLFNTKKGA